jgi:hypothetical protein
MDPKIAVEIATKNSADVEAIVAIIGVTNLLKLVPHFMNILATVQAQPK